MQSKQLATTTVATIRAVRERLAPEAHNATELQDLIHGLSYGYEWLWNGVDPVLTAAGVRRVAERLAELGAEADAASLRALAETLVPQQPLRPAEPAPATVRAMGLTRSHLPYADADDAEIFSTLAATCSHHEHPRHH